MWVRACANSYCALSKDVQVLRSRLVIAKQHAVVINNDDKSTIHARVISMQIVRHIEAEIERKEQMLIDICDGYTFDRMYRDYI